MEGDVLTGLAAFLGGLGGTVLLLMPGYIIGKIYSRGIPGPELSDTAFIAASAIGGVITHLLFLFWTVPLAQTLVDDWQDGSGLGAPSYTAAAVWAGTVLLAAPAFLGALFARLSSVDERSSLTPVLRWLALTTALRTQEAWNWKFRQVQDADKGYWVRVRLREDGGTFLGKFGRRSLASSNYDRRDLYLEKTWEIDDEGRPRAESAPNAGVWLAGDQIISIEFLEFGPPERLDGEGTEGNQGVAGGRRKRQAAHKRGSDQAALE